ncbi:MAG: CoA-acylating methylmalonate-semialdehyde dehydrogenase [Bdellovibrionales bacterium]|nr:CoA-acylating methylmalonate-semialdehyde dehydrogenase [Bdellovibrionales bacterium]
MSDTNYNSNLEVPKTSTPCLNYCNGEWLKPSGKEFQIKSPYTNSVIGQSHESTAQDLQKIIGSAKKAQKTWGATPIKERSLVMFRFRELLLRDMHKISNQISIECGKTLAEAQAEINKGIEVIEFALSIQNLDVGGKTEVSRGVFCEYRREPLGVVAAITPFNFPAMVPLWMIPIAITLGNSFIWKPSDKTPLTSILLAKLLTEAGLPKGVFSVAQGGKSTVELILDHPEIEAIGFVGSTQVAKEIYRRGSQNLKRVLALGGAKNHILLMPDADLELTARGISDSFTGCAGQRCMAASVLCAIAGNAEEEKMVNQLIAAITKQASQTALGRNLGAIISQESLSKLQSAISQSEKDGAQILLDGRKPSPPPPFESGNWLSPTILDHVKPGTQAAIDELFGPVLAIIRCKSLSEALEIQNSNIYGNAVSIFTQNGGAAEKVASYGKAGMVGVNIGVPVPREPFSFGGTHESKFGQGDITGVHSLNLWSNMKKITTKWAAQKDWTWMG